MTNALAKKQPAAESPLTPQPLHTSRFPGESDAYRAARDGLLRDELELRRHVEQVAARRRGLPLGGPVPEDYQFEGESGPVRMSDLFGRHDTLITYNYMFGPQRKRPCPSCTSMLSGLDGIIPDVAQRVAFVVVAKSPIEKLKPSRPSAAGATCACSPPPATASTATISASCPMARRTQCTTCS